jgi:PAS domain S-box-containing protein
MATQNVTAKDENGIFLKAEKAIAEANDRSNSDELRQLLGALLLRARSLDWQLKEMKLTESEVQSQRKQSDNLFEFAPVGYFILGQQNIIVNTNITASDMFGSPKQKLVNTPFMDLIDPSFASVFRKYLDDIAGTGQRLSIEIRMRRADGSLFDVGLQTVALYDGSRLTYRVSVSDISPQKKTEKALIASEKRYRSYIELTEQIGWTTDANGEVIDDVPAWRRFTGQSYEEIKGWGWSAAVHPDDLERTVNTWKKAVAEKNPYEVEYRVRRHDGVYRDLLVRGVPVIMDDGSVREWVGTGIDITDRKAAEKRILESEEKYRELADSFPETIFETDLKGTVTYVNWKGLDNFAITPEQIKRGVNIFDFIAPSQLERARDKFQRVLRLEEPGPEEYHLHRRGGTSFPAIVNSSVVHRDGEIVGVRGVVVDITRRKAAQEQMRRQALALENIAEAVWFTDLDFKVQFWNKTAERRYGWTAEEAIGRDLHELIGIEYPTQDRESTVRELLEKGQWQGELRHHRKDGSVLDVLVTRSLLKDTDVRGMVVVAQDITRQKAAQAELAARESRFHSTLDAMLEGCLILDRDMRYIYVNDAMAKQARMTKEEMIGKTVTDLFPGSESTEAFQQVKECLEKGVPHHMDNEYVFPDGVRRRFQLRIEPVPEGVLILSLEYEAAHGD